MAGGGSSEVRRLAADLDGLAEDHGRVVDALKVAEGRASCALLQSDSALKSCKDLWTAVFELREVVKGLEVAAQAQEKLISGLSMRLGVGDAKAAPLSGGSLAPGGRRRLSRRNPRAAKGGSYGLD